MLKEPGWQLIRDRIDEAESTVVSAPTMLEAHIVLTNRTGKDALPLLDAFLNAIGGQVIPFTEAQWRLAAEGYLRYGKSRHSAALNFGDCIVYGTARATQLPLFFKGDDFELSVF